MEVDQKVTFLLKGPGQHALILAMRVIRPISVGILSVLLLITGFCQAEARIYGEVFARAMALHPDTKRGETAFLARCSACHGEDAWGSYDGEYPQLAGQHAKVIIKQLSDIHAGIRSNPKMTPVVKELVNEAPQLVADIAGYLEGLPMNPYPEEGYAEDLAVAELTYRQKCASCHGIKGEGDGSKLYPLVQGQHYEYLLREMRWLRDGERGNADPKMVEQIRDMSDDELALMADYLSRLMPPAERLGED